MNRQKIAQELVNLARELVGKKGEVPEAFKKQWKNKDKDNDGKENEPKPDFLKKKKSSDVIASSLIGLARELTAADTFKCPKCDSKVLEQTGYCVKCKKKVKKARERKAAYLSRDDANAVRRIQDMVARREFAEAVESSNALEKTLRARNLNDAADEVESIGDGAADLEADVVRQAAAMIRKLDKIQRM